MSSEIANEIKLLKNKVAGKFEQTMGLRVWGKTALGTIVEIRVDGDGKLQTSNP